MLVGEKFRVRVPHAQPVQHRNVAPMFYTARAPLTYKSEDAQEMLEYNQAVSERFTTRKWSKPLPLDQRRRDVSRCACCFAKFILVDE